MTFLKQLQPLFTSVRLHKNCFVYFHIIITPMFGSPCFFLFITSNWTFHLKKQKDHFIRTRDVQCVYCLMWLQESKKLLALIKLTN